jgi:hypothetical protein
VLRSGTAYNLSYFLCIALELCITLGLLSYKPGFYSGRYLPILYGFSYIVCTYGPFLVLGTRGCNNPLSTYYNGLYSYRTLRYG